MLSAMQDLAMSEVAQRQVEVLLCADSCREWVFCTQVHLRECSEFWKMEARRSYQDFMQFGVAIREEARDLVKCEREGNGQQPNERAA